MNIYALKNYPKEMNNWKNYGDKSAIRIGYVNRKRKQVAELKN